MKFLYCDRNLAVLLKPAGIDSEHELPQLVKEELKREVYCVHRLDRTVSGVMVYALNAESAAALSLSIQNHAFQKEYLAVCSGTFEEKSGSMTDFLLKDNQKKKAFPVKSVRKGVKEARLTYEILEETQAEGQPFSLARVRLETGRYHQIRAQFAARKHPLLGDGRYGSRVKGCAPALFSEQITFPHPVTGDVMRFSASPEKIFPWNLFPSIGEDAAPAGGAL